MNEMNNVDSIVSTAQAGLRLDPPPTETEIAEFLGRLARGQALIIANYLDIRALQPSDYSLAHLTQTN